MTAVLALSLGACAHLPPLTPYRDPLTASEHAQLGASYAAGGLNRQAEEQFRDAVRGDPKDPGAWTALGNLAFDAGDLEGAERAYRNALKAAPHDPGASNNLAMVYLERGERLEEAARLAEDALSRRGRLAPYVLDTLANVYMRQGRLEEARVALAQAEAAGPHDVYFQERVQRTRERLSKEVPSWK